MTKENKTPRVTGHMMIEWLYGLVICALIGMCAVWAMNGTSFLDSGKGMVVLIILGFVSLLIKALLPFNCPLILVLSIISILVACPISPIASQVSALTKCININATVTMILAYGGLNIGHDLGAFKKLGWRAAIVGVLVLFGTWIWSALIAEGLLNVTGYFG